MRIAIHQPLFMPYYGFFQKLMEADVFVLLNDVQFSNDNFQNYNRVKTPHGAMNLRVPIVKRFGQLICDVVVNDSVPWREKLCKSLQLNYARAPHFSKVMPLLARNINAHTTSLQDISVGIITDIVEALNVRKEIILSSDIQSEGRKTDRVVSICKALGADEYLSGRGASAYQDARVFAENGIALEYITPKPPMYKQLWGKFVNDLSFVDYLMNVGMEVPREWST